MYRQYLVQHQSSPASFLAAPPPPRARCIDDSRISAPALAELLQAAAVDFPPELLSVHHEILVSGGNLHSHIYLTPQVHILEPHVYCACQCSHTHPFRPPYPAVHLPADPRGGRSRALRPRGVTAPATAEGPQAVAGALRQHPVRCGTIPCCPSSICRHPVRCTTYLRPSSIQHP